MKTSSVWISVENKLPEAGVEVEACDKINSHEWNLFMKESGEWRYSDLGDTDVAALAPNFWRPIAK